MIEYQNKKYSYSQLEKETGISRGTLKSRWMAGDREEKLVRPVRQKKDKLPLYITYDKEHEEYAYNRTVKGKTLSKGKKTLKEILKLKKEIDDYVNKNHKLPELKDERLKIDYNATVGKKFGELLVKEVVVEKNRKKLLCKCSCGKTVKVLAPALVSGQRKSCGHLEGVNLKKDNERLKEIQRNSLKPLATNKTTGEKYISYNKAKESYDFEITRHKTRFRKRFYDLKEAVAFKHEFLEKIKENDGKIPKEYL